MANFKIKVYSPIERYKFMKIFWILLVFSHTTYAFLDTHDFQSEQFTPLNQAEPDKDCVDCKKEVSTPAQALESFIDGFKNLFLSEEQQMKANYYFFLQGKNFGEIVELKNCIDYSGCHVYGESLAGGPGNYRAHIDLPLTTKQLKKIITNCGGFTAFKGKITIKNKDKNNEKVDLTQFLNAENSLSEFDQSIIPIRLPSASDIPKIHQEVSALLRQRKFKEAVQSVVDNLEIPLFGYKIQIEGVDDNVAVTDHQNKTVSVGKGWLTDSCAVIRMIRHEAEHIKQIQHAQSCGYKSNFRDHKKRERCAYMNDMATAPVFCPQRPRMVQEAEQGFMRYLNQ